MFSYGGDVFFICTLSCFICGPGPLGLRHKCTTLFVLSLYMCK